MDCWTIYDLARLFVSPVNATCNVKRQVKIVEKFHFTFDNGFETFIFEDRF